MHLKRSATASDITPQQEAEMRRRVRKCPMPDCGVWMTNKPGLPNSKELDHILPINQGGTHTHGNVRIICRTCNQKRPKDGSDYIGTLTLWSQAPGVVIVPRKPKKPKPPPSVCKCGASFAARGGTIMCPACTEGAGRRAAELHATGMTWAQIAPLVGYTTDEGVRYAAKRIGYTPSPRVQEKKPKPVRLCACGRSPIWQGGECRLCRADRAARAVHLRYEENWTLRDIAIELGCNSITTISNWLKEAGTPPPQPYWRPGA